MRALVLFSLGLLTSVISAYEPGKNYHDVIGIPLAKEIKTFEDAFMSTNMPYVYRIKGGEVAPDYAYPYLAGLLVSFWNNTYMRYEELRSFCGASLLSPNRLVTAAHCWNNGVHQAAMLEVILGSNMLFYGGDRSYTSTVISHPYWDYKRFINDIAVIYLPTNVRFSERVQPIALPDPADLTNDWTGQWAVAAGYGKTSFSDQSSYPRVNHVNLLVMAEEECRPFYCNPRIQSSHICTSGYWNGNTCSGDSGGPLVIFRNGVPFLIGVCSFSDGFLCDNNTPSVFSRVTSFYNFIVENM